MKSNLLKSRIVICKSFKDKQKMRQAGRSAATVLDRLCKFVQPGMSTLEIDEKGVR